MTMKALSVWEPYATAIVHGWKPIETRTWATSYRGPLAICASPRSRRPARPAGEDDP